MSTVETPDRTCFFICPIGEDLSSERERSDLLLDCLLKPVLEPLGFSTIKRADQMPEPGMITNQIIQQLLSCDLVVADLAGSNANVFYELAIRHAARKPAIHLFLPQQKIPFDLAGSRAIPVDTENVRAFESSKKDLKAQVSQIIKEGENCIDSPFATALAVISMTTTGSSVEKILAHVVNSQSEILSAIQTLKPTQASFEGTKAAAAWLRGLKNQPDRYDALRRAVHQHEVENLRLQEIKKSLKHGLKEELEMLLGELENLPDQHPRQEEIKSRIAALEHAIED